jgi:hypothetical protein
MPFDSATPTTATTNSFLAFMLTDSSLAGAQSILSRAVSSDSTFPQQTLYLEKSSDFVRNYRYHWFDNAIFDTRIQGGYSAVDTNSDFTGFTNALGFQTGMPNLTLANNAFVPGAMGDSMTSFAGEIFEDSGQTPLLAFLEAGAAASYGTVIEPCNYFEKFPNPLNYFYQSRGFSVAEAYYQSVSDPHQGLFVGDPLAAPFARRGKVLVNSSLNNTPTLAGEITPKLICQAASTNLPLSRVDLFIDGVWFQTITNIQPSPGDQLSMTLNGIPIHYSVPANSTIESVAAGLAAAINSVSNTTAVAASLSGFVTSEIERNDGGFSPLYATTRTMSDRVELHSLNPATAAANVEFGLTPVTNSLPPTTFLIPGQPGFLDSIATGYHYFFITNAPLVGDWMQLTVTKTNEVSVTIGVTNTVAGTTGDELISYLFSQIAANPLLSSADGVYGYLADSWNNPPAADFFIYAQSPGWPASRIQVTLTGSPNMGVLPSGTSLLQDNLSDLQPRDFIYVASGALSIPVTFSLNTTSLSDGFHNLTFVAYEGTSVKTQTAVSRSVIVQNQALQASFNILYGGATTDINSVLQFQVLANTNAIASVQLFGNGGLLGVVTNQANALFSVSGSTLGLGLQSFYAIVTATNGNQYRTQTQWIRLIGAEPPIQLFVKSNPLTVSWPATAGRSYDIFMTTNLLYSFQKVSSFTPINSAAIWTNISSTSTQGYYRVRTSN